MKRTWNRILAVATAAVMTLGLAACGAAPAQETGGAYTLSAAQTTPAAPAKLSSSDTVYVISDAEGGVEKVIGDADALGVDVRISYQLDGSPVTPAELAGKSGRVTIRFDYDNRRTATVETDGGREEITVPVAMVSGVVLNKEHFSNVEISSGKLLDDGSRILAVGLALPGLREDLDPDGDSGVLPEKLTDYVEIRADAVDFSLDMTLSAAVSDLLGDLELENGAVPDADTLSADLDRLTDGMAQLLNGSGALYNGLETLLAKSGELGAGVDQLATGAAALRDGAAALDAGAAAVQGGAGQLSAGLNTLSSNSAQLDAGAEQVFRVLLASANTQLAAAGLDCPALTVGNYAEVLDGQIAALDETAVTNTARAQVAAAVEAHRDEIREKVTAAVREEVGRQVAGAVRAQVEGQVAAAVWEAALPQVTAQVTAAVTAQVGAQVTEAVQAGVTAQVLAAMGLDESAYAAADETVRAGVAQAVAAQMNSKAVLDRIQAKTAEQMASDAVQAVLSEQIAAQRQSEAVLATVAQQTDAQLQSEQVQGVIAATTEEKMGSEEVLGLIAQNTETQVQLAIAQAMAGEEVQAKLAAAAQGAQSLISLKASLDSYATFYNGLQSYTAGVDQLAVGAGALKSGADQLRSGSGQLSAGAASLSEGLTTLQSSIPALTQGITQLRDGSARLHSGLQQLDDEGISKLTELAEGDAVRTLSRLKTVLGAAKEYEAAHSAEKVIYRSGAIGV